MNRTLFVVILVVAAIPEYAQAQQPSAAKLKADAQNVVRIISGDEVKTQTYCEIAEVSDQADEAAEQQDTTKADELSQKMNQLAGKLGPDYVALIGGLQDIDPDSQDGQEISSILEGLDKLCED